MTRRVLVVEDDVGSQILLRGLLSKIDPFLYVTCVPTAESGYRELVEAFADDDPYGVVIADLDLPGSNGLVLLDASRKLLPEVDFLFVSGVTDADWLKKTASRAAKPALLHKPILEAELRTYWKENVEKHFKY